MPVHNHPCATVAIEKLKLKNQMKLQALENKTKPLKRMYDETTERRENNQIATSSSSITGLKIYCHYHC